MGGDQVTFVDFFKFFFDFCLSSWFNELYAVLIGFLVIGVVLCLFGRKRYIHV